jgi:hypothetical protein
MQGLPETSDIEEYRFVVALKVDIATETAMTNPRDRDASLVDRRVVEYAAACRNVGAAPGSCGCGHGCDEVVHREPAGEAALPMYRPLIGQRVEPAGWSGDDAASHPLIGAQLIDEYHTVAASGGM